jgi:hypothetical protein
MADLDEISAPTLPYPNWFGARVFDAPVKAALA